MVHTSKKDDTFVEFVCDQLTQLDAAIYKPMFGGYGLYEGSLFFGLVFDGRLYLKTNEASRARYEEWGTGPFQTTSKKTLKNYYEVPGDIVEDGETLNEIALEAIEVAAGG